MAVLASASLTLGWNAAMCAIVANGSYGVPIKSETCQRLNIDPLVFQTYKTIMCLLFSFSVVWAMEIPIVISPWGIVSGLFWVPGGVATILAVKLCGLSLAVAVGNSLIALVSFVWGVFIFEEKVHSKPIACLAIVLMMTGFTGMSFFSSGEKQNQVGEPISSLKEPLLENKQDKVAGAKKLDEEASDSDEWCDTDSAGSDTTSLSSASLDTTVSSCRDSPQTRPEPKILRRRGSTVNDQYNNNNTSPRVLLFSAVTGLPLRATPEGCTTLATITSSPPPGRESPKPGTVKIFGREVSSFLAGLTIAAMGGIWGGSIMIPMKLCDESISGLGYLASFSSGATLVTLACWVFRFFGTMGRRRSIDETYKLMPSFHLKEMWFLGGLSGLLWSTGNLFGILAVHHIGSVGYCVAQSSMLVAGMWGIFYFGEVKGKAMIAKWFMAAFTTISGIILLAYEKGA